MIEAEQTIPTPEAEPEHVRAARLIREKFAALGILATFGAPVPKVRDNGRGFNDDPKPQIWPHVLFTVEFSRSYGNDRACKLATEFSIGTGLAPWKDARVIGAASSNHGVFGSAAVKAVAERESLSRRGISRYRPEIEAEAAAIACKLAKWTPDPAEIFAGLCREGFDARDVTFEDWAGDFGYDPDSREGERIFNACRQCWTDALRLVSAADAEEFAELAGQL